jgi:hypothetical protein
MVRLVNEDPVRASDVSTHLLQAGEKCVKHLWPVFEWEPEQVHDRVTLRAS